MEQPLNNQTSQRPEGAIGQYAVEHSIDSRSASAPKKNFIMRHRRSFSLVVPAVVIVAIISAFIFSPVGSRLHLTNSTNSSPGSQAQATNGSSQPANTTTGQTSSSPGSSRTASTTQPNSSQTTTQAAAGSASMGTDDASLNNDLQSINSSLGANQQSMNAAASAINNQQLDTPPSN